MMNTFKRIAAILLLIAGAGPALAEIKLAIGEPSEDSVKSGIGQISGWAVSDRRIVSVEAFIDGISLGSVPYGGSRMDVASAFPDFPDSEHSGWAMKWNYSLHEEGEHLLKVIATDEDGFELSREVVFTTTGFRSEFIPDPGDIRTFGAVVENPVDGRIVITGAEVEGEIVDFELSWDTATQQFLIDRVTYDDEQEVNRSPTADAGPNKTVETEVTVLVEGSGSDPDGSISLHSWTQVSGPEVSLTNDTDWTVRFTSPAEASQVRLRLTVTDDQGASDSDDVIISVENSEPEPNQAPSADAGPNPTVQAGDSVSITGNGSDSDGEIVAWSWSQVSGLEVDLQNSGSRTVRFTAPETAGQIRLRLSVTDNDGASDTDDVIITVEAPGSEPNQAPTANAGANQTVQPGDNVSITGSGSDSDGSIVAWSWTQISGTQVSLSGADSQQVGFTAPESAGDIRLRLTVTDNDGASDSDDVTITVEESSGTDNTTGKTLSSMLPLINEARGQTRMCGDEEYPAQPELEWSDSLADIAMQHSMDMARQGYFSHDSIDGTSMRDRVFSAWSGNTIGENIAASSNDREKQFVVDQWLQSPGHCRLIMADYYTHAGVGTGQDHDNNYAYHYFWTLDFGG
jgi:uncharacterized protein YkwD